MRADNGVHHFTYAFTAWESSFLECNVVKQGYELNVTLGIVAGSVPKISATSIEKDNIILDTIKPALDQSDDVILRLYESKKSAVTTKVYCSLGKKAYLCDMMEKSPAVFQGKSG